MDTQNDGLEINWVNRESQLLNLHFWHPWGHGGVDPPMEVKMELKRPRMEADGLTVLGGFVDSTKWLVGECGSRLEKVGD